MKIILFGNPKSSFNNSNVRWYLSSQEIWIGQEKNYFEIEETIEQSYGSFKWLYASADTLLFDKKTLEFTSGVVKVQEPINISCNKLADINAKEGIIKLAECKNENCELCDYSTYYPDEDTLILVSATIKNDNQISAFQVTKDFAFIEEDNEIKGIILKNASSHIVEDDYGIIPDGVEKTSDVIKNVLVQYLQLIARLNLELTDDEETELLNDFNTLLEELKTSDIYSINAIKESIINIVDYM